MYLLSIQIFNLVFRVFLDKLNESNLNKPQSPIEELIS